MSETIQILEKPNAEINFWELKNIENALQQTDIDAIAIKIFKEMEQEKFEADMKQLRENTKNNSKYQQEIQEANDKLGIISNASSIGEQLSTKLDSVIKPFKLIINRVSNQLTAIDAVIEYEKTGDGIKVSLKVGASFIKSKIFEFGAATSIRAAIITFIALAIAGMSIVGATIIGIVVLTIGVSISWWVSQKAEELINNMGSYIEKFSISLTPQQREYFSTSHCHKTMTNIQNNARRQILINGYPAPKSLIDTFPDNNTLKNIQSIREQLWQIGQTK
ncbi:hypothetical protein [Helicobacter sp. T3_23-1056]